MKVAVLMGGPSAEAEVSRASAREVAAALTDGGHQAELVEVDRQVAKALLATAPDVVFPALHGPPGEDGTVQGFLDILQIPYVGSGVHGSAVAMDKALAKAIFRRAGLPVAQDLVFGGDTSPTAAEKIVRSTLGEHVVIKPLFQGSALGVTPVANGVDLSRGLEEALSFGGGILVEPFVHGREITVGVLDLHGESPRPLPVIEIRTAAGEWYDYRNRYTAGASEHIVPAPLADKVSQRLREIAVAAHAALGLRDLSRADFIVTEANDIVLLEVNTMPGMTPTSLFPDGARAMGLGFVELTDALVGSARARGTRRSA